MKHFRHRPFIFILVGSAAALVHLCTVVLLVQLLGIPPLVANIGGWLCAFSVSYGGHYFLTFADHQAPVVRSVMRFFVLSASGFAINESAYAILLNVTGLSYYALLAMILVCVAVLTYIIGRRWAFVGTRP
jgi:putative flippase GtrA